MQVSVLKEPGAKRESLGNGNVAAIRDGHGRLRDMEYRSGDVRSRRFEYSSNTPDANGEYPLNKMVVDSKTHGLQVWKKNSDNLWVEQKRGTPMQGGMQVDQQTGVFYAQERGKTSLTYSPSGRRNAPEDAVRPDRSKDADRAVIPAGVEPGGDRSVKPPSNNNGSRGVDSGRIEPRFDKAQFETKLEQTFGKPRQITESNYADNLFGSAETKKPIVMTFGRSSDPNMVKVQEGIERAKKQANGSAEFMFVDLDKVDPNSPIGEYALKTIEKKYGTPFTMVFNQKQGEGSTPVIPEPPSHHQKGPLREQDLSNAIAAAARIQGERQIQTGRERGPDGGDARQVSTEAKIARDLLDEAVKPYKDRRTEVLMKGLPPEQQLKVYSEAINIADSINNPGLRAETRAMAGFFFIGWGKELADKGNKVEADKRYLAGAEYMLLAGSYDKNLWVYPEFTEKLRNSALPGTVAETLIERGAKDAKWFFPTAEEHVKDKAAAGPNARDRYTKLISEQMKRPKAPANPYGNYGPAVILPK